jgi:hypothetical protein
MIGARHCEQRMLLLYGCAIAAASRKNILNTAFVISRWVRMSAGSCALFNRS